LVKPGDFVNCDRYNGRLNSPAELKPKKTKSLISAKQLIHVCCFGEPSQIIKAFQEEN